ncbi:hypothetical protein WKI68_42220 [Streptomyces sp. MS1.HAVA.3]|uniref:Uncharacterized protein n=1 Tax=Streptomyces caledonius TaxID=3134107 RepID=A0ABU8UDU8_9ACTN
MVAMTAVTGASEIRRTEKGAHPWQLGLELCALLAPLPPGLPMVVDIPLFIPVFIFTLIVVAIPLLQRSRQSSFRTACLAIGLGLLPWGLFAWMFGSLIFVLSSPFLLLAYFADPRSDSGTAKTVLGLAGVTVAGVLWVYVWMWQTFG